MNQKRENSPLFMLVAGELSGDLLGSGLIKSLKRLYPNAHFFGVGGPLMIAEGFESIAPMDTLSVMGLFEVIVHLPALLKLKWRLVNEAIKRKPIAFIGIDAPDFNLRLAKTLKEKSMTTFHYVSPSIWVWREKRIFTIKKAIDRVLCLFPFEVPIYAKYGVDAVCVGHRLGDEISLETNQDNAREVLAFEKLGQYLAILPGSRQGEVKRLLPIFLATAQRLYSSDTRLKFIIPAATPKIYYLINELLSKYDRNFINNISIVHGNSRLVMEASDAVLLASGTASLEAMLLKKPMIVAYKFNSLTAWFAKRIVKTPFFSLPNILSGKAIVPEVFQEAVTAENLFPLIKEALSSRQREKLTPVFLQLHESLRLNADIVAAQSIQEKLLETKEAPPLT